MRLIKFVMKVFYANDIYSKYGIPGLNYFMALTMTAFYIILTGFAFLNLLYAISPRSYIRSLAPSGYMSMALTSVLLFVIVFLFLRTSIKEESIKEILFSKEYLNRSKKYLIAYGFFVVLFIIFVGLNFLKHYKK
jgi:hypothetical protein